MKNLDRRDFLKKTSLSGAAIATASILTGSKNVNKRDSYSRYMGDYAAPKLEVVRAAFIGVGARGTGHARQIASIEGTEVVAISDLYQDLTQRSKDNCKEIGNGQRHNDIAIYYGDENKWKTMLKEVKPDIVFISTNWNNHAPMVIEVMNNGAHAFVEVPIATTIQDIWKIINTSERTKRHCMMMENVNYGRDELMYLNMCRKGIIGDFLHAEAAYIHELRFQMEEQIRGTGSWRTYHYAKGKGNLYPTHGLGPVAQYMNLSRTDDNFNSLVSYSTPALGRKSYAKKNYSNDHKWNNLDYLIVDLPPGTGDIQLTLAQKIPVTGAVIVTTPQDIALLDARKGLKMFEKVNVPIIGIVENMATHICSQCGHEEYIFGEGGGFKMAKDYEVELLGSLPLDISIRKQLDDGNPTVVSDGDGKIAATYEEIAINTSIRIASLNEDTTNKFPKIVIEKN